MKKKFLLGLLALLGLAAEPAFGAATPWVFKGASAMALFDSASCKFQFVTGSANPSSSATDGCKGSVYCRTGASGGTCYVKTDDGSSTNWSAIALGAASGDVVGPGSATDNAVARFDSTTGKLIQNSGVTISDTNVMSGLADPAAAQDAVTRYYQNTNLHDPSLALVRIWDFIGYNQGSSTVEEGWVGSVAGAGLTNVQGGHWVDATHPGVVNLRSGTGATDHATLAQGAIISHGQGVFEVEYLLRLEDLSDGTNTYVVLAGTHSVYGAATDITTGCAFRYTHGTNSGEWEFKCCTAGVCTTVDTNQAAVADTWFKLGYICNAACTSCQAYYNRVAVGSAVTSNCPTSNSAALNVHIEKTLGSSTRNLYMDYAKVKYLFTTPR